MTSDDIDLDRLRTYLAREVPQIGPLERITKYAGGQSNPTYLLETDHGRIVLRAKPPGKLLVSAHQVDREFRVMAALAASGVAVPKMLHLADDADPPIGRAFFVMDHVEGRVLWDPALPDETPEARAAIYDAMNATLAALHRIDPAAIGLADFGRAEGYFARQTNRWTQQYHATRSGPHAAMDDVIAWLNAHMPPEDGQGALVHGDFRLDNLIFASDGPEIRAVLDWELSTLGHPLADLAYQCMQLRLPNNGAMRGLGGVDRSALGIPSETEYVAAYCARREIAAPKNWNFYLVFCFFRLAAILEGVVRRAADGNASNPEAARTYAAAIPVLTNEAVTIIHGSTHEKPDPA